MNHGKLESINRESEAFAKQHFATRWKLGLSIIFLVLIGTVPETNAGWSVWLLIAMLLFSPIVQFPKGKKARHSFMWCTGLVLFGNITYVLFLR